ncbi:Serine hydroxymethyltransferase 2, mitochondrial [Capsicum baccatum]|uniref:Serine hydroxymethyltransferase 2, mitochondrial n=1 Tax=Capsicum baccatum TaxID=33114 RepID=A0A2G2XC70_CAPBA|nr:Serine hydroxymethyltransferase 2, mitochondrial [Capsicum baccatum]
MQGFTEESESSLPNEAAYEKEKNGVTWPKQLNAPLEEVDPEIADISEHEKARQWKETRECLVCNKKYCSRSTSYLVFIISDVESPITKHRHQPPIGIDGSRVEKVLEAVHIAANKNTVPGDVSAMVPDGIRMGTPALTSRGFIEEDFVKVAEFFDAAVKIAVKIKAETSDQ